MMNTLLNSIVNVNASRAALDDCFAYNNWNALNSSEKRDVLQALENRFAAQQGRPPKAVLAVPLEDREYGGFNGHIICINENLLNRGTLYSSPYARPMPDANMQAYDTIAHEGYHAYQSYALQHPEIHSDKAQLRQWALNKGKYYENGSRYLIQPKERDAWQHGYGETTEAFRGIQERNGAEPGASRYEAMSVNNSYNVALENAVRYNPNVLQDMEEEMRQGCESKGIFYEYDSGSGLDNSEHDTSGEQEAQIQDYNGGLDQQTHDEPLPETEQSEAEGPDIDNLAESQEAEQSEAEGLDMDSLAESQEAEQSEAGGLDMDSLAESQEAEQSETWGLDMDSLAESPEAEQSEAEGLDMDSLAESQGAEQSEAGGLDMDSLAESQEAEQSEAGGLDMGEAVPAETTAAETGGESGESQSESVSM